MMGDARALHQAAPQQQPIQAQAQRGDLSFKQNDNISNWGWQPNNK
jgi:hypothetical protein